MNKIRLLAFVLICWQAQPAAAQIADTGKPSKEARKALRAARKYPVPDDLRRAHLAVDKRDLRTGQSEGRTNHKDERRRYRFDNDGTARVSEPSYRALRRKQLKSEEQQKK